MNSTEILNMQKLIKIDDDNEIVNQLENKLICNMIIG